MIPHRSTPCVPHVAARPWVFRALAGLLAVLVLLAGSAIGTDARASGSAVRRQGPGSFALGVYAGPGGTARVSQFESEIGARVPYAMEFVGGQTWSSIADPQEPWSAWAAAARTMVWGVPMLPARGASLAVGASGAYDGYFASLARSLVAHGQGRSIIRLGWEFNLPVFPWAAAGSAAHFDAFWRHIVTTMRSVPGARFTFEWNPSRGDIGIGDLTPYYPGNAFVDYVGLDVYDVEWKTYPGGRAEFARMETEPDGLNWLASFSARHHKSTVIPEWGLGWGTCTGSGAAVTGNAAVCGGDDPTFVNEMISWCSSHHVVEATFWDYGTSRLNNGKNPRTERALRKDMGTPEKGVPKQS